MASRITLKFLPNGKLPPPLTNFGFNHILSKPAKIVPNNRLKAIQKAPHNQLLTRLQPQQQHFDTDNFKVNDKSCFYCGQLNTVIDQAKNQ